VLDAASNSHGPTSWPKKTQAADDAIPFRDLAKLAFPKKTVLSLAAASGRSPSAVKYWLSGRHEPPGRAIRIVLGEIIRRIP
jgi:hypothetical protein